LASLLGGFAVAPIAPTQKVFNWLEVHHSKVTFYKIHTLVNGIGIRSAKLFYVHVKEYSACSTL
jgi:hypothetical protein